MVLSEISTSAALSLLNKGPIHKTLCFGDYNTRDRPRMRASIAGLQHYNGFVAWLFVKTCHTQYCIGVGRRSVIVYRKRAFTAVSYCFRSAYRRGISHAVLHSYLGLHTFVLLSFALTLRRLMSYIYIYIYIYMEHQFLMFLDHTQRRSTVGRTPLDE